MMEMACGLPASSYIHAEAFSRETDQIFRREWLPVARAEEVKHPGSYVTFSGKHSAHSRCVICYRAV
jgi:phenylpropionate dioxygenase-like ring-hydroxylating dioxygenase large terminal subunit